MCEEKIKEIWQDDKLGRQEDAQHIINFLEARVAARKNSKQTGTYVLNIDAEWGYGKTFFLERLQKQLKAQGNLVAFVNAWKDDHTPDPFVAVLAAINKVVEEQLPKNAKKATKAGFQLVKTGGKFAIKVGASIAKHQLKKHLGDELSDILEEHDVSAENSKVLEDAVSESLESILDTHSENLIKSFDEAKKSTETFKSNFIEFLKYVDGLKNKKTPFYILIDELDRCRPTYAIELLERVKHLFDIDNVVFIVATDSTQLCHSIKAVYGQGFESGKYLHRFFDRVYKFEKIEPKQFVKFLFERSSIDTSKFSVAPHLNDAVEFFFLCAGYFNLELRSIEQCFEHLEMITDMWPIEKTRDKKYGEKIQLSYLLPLIFIYNSKGEKYFQEFLKNKYTHNDPTLVSKFIIPYSEFNFRNQRHEKHTLSLSKLFSKVSLAANNNIRTEPGDDMSVFERFLFEATYSNQTIYVGRYVDDNYKNPLQNYPALVQTAGKFKKPELAP